MTDRVRQVIVTLDDNYRIDDAEPLLKLLSCIKGVARVSPHISTASDVLAREVVRAEYEAELHQAITAVFHPRRKWQDPLGKDEYDG